MIEPTSLTGVLPRTAQPIMSGRKWEPWEVDFLRSAYREGVSPQQIADALGREKRAVINKAYYLHLSKKTWRPEEVALLRRLYVAHDPPNLYAIAEEMGRTRWAIAMKANELGITVTGRMRRAPIETARMAARRRAANPDTRLKLRLATLKQFREKGHPRGMLGKTHTPEVRKRISEAQRKRWGDPNSDVNTPEYRQKMADACMASAIKRLRKGDAKVAWSRAKSGTRDDLGIYVRSRWEANYARYLNWLKDQGQIAGWEYEPDTFLFEAIKRGTRSYTPDFKVAEKDGRVIYHEVKGWMDPKSVTKLKRMAKYYPDVKILVIGPSEYGAIAKWHRMIPNWEGEGK